MMKKITFLVCFLFTGLNLFAQNQWEDFTATADSLDAKRHFDASLSYRAKALEAAKNQPESIQKMLYGLQLFTQAEHDFYKTKGPDPEAYALMQNAADVLQENDAPQERMSKVYFRLAENAHDYMYDSQGVEKYMQTAFDYYEKTTEKDTVYLGGMMQFLGYAKILSGDFDGGIEVSEKGLEIMDQLHTKSNAAYTETTRLYYNLSLVYGVNFLNIPLKEYQYIGETEKILSVMAAPDIELLITSYRRLALFELYYKNFQKAKSYMDKVWPVYEGHRDLLSERTGFKAELALYRADFAILTETGEEEQMLAKLEKVEHIVQNNDLDEVEKANYKGILNLITRYYMGEKPDLNKAKKYNDRALAVHVDSKKAPYSLESFNQTTRINHLTISFLKKEYKKAMALIVEAEKTSGYHTDRLMLDLKAKSLFGLSKPKEAVDVINKLLVVLHKDNQGFQFPKSSVEDFSPGYTLSDTQILVGLAETVRDYYGKYAAEEEKLYWMALIHMENNINNTPLNRDLKRTFDKITSGLMNSALERGFSTAENSRLLNFMEVLTSQELINNFLLKREIAGNTDLYKLVEEEQYVRSYMTFLKKEQQKSQDEDTKQQLFEKERELKKITEQLAAQYRQSQLFAAPKIDITASSGKNIIKFNVTGDELFKTRLYKGKLTYQKIADYPALKQEIENYLSQLTDLQTPVSTLKKQGLALYEKLFDDDFNTTDPTVIIPDDILHYLPFELLVKDQKYLIEDHTISYASNFFFLNSVATPQKQPKRKKVAFFAPEYSGSVRESQLAVRGASYSLAGAAEEVNEIAKFTPGNLYVGSAASKTRFKSLKDDISILHLAMHSNLNDEDPELSNLMFSDSEQDYEMYISELYGLNFSADLAVLSACNTGIGGFKDGGNLVSMHHAFTIAGIPATIASLWHAHDQSTKEIMVAFYQNLQKGADKATALRQAKLSYLANTTDENLLHPFYWAGFVLSGDESPVQLANKSFWKEPMGVAATIMGIAALITIITLVNRRRRIFNDPAAPF